MQTVDLGGVDATVAKYQGLIISPHVELFCFNLHRVNISMGLVQFVLCKLL